MAKKKETHRAKIVVIGDGACGKTCLLEVYKSGIFPEDYVPTIVDNFVMKEEVEAGEVVLTLWDTSGQDEYDALRPLSYSNANLIVICYSIEKKDRLGNIEEKWLTEIQNLCKNVPYFLMGLKADVRNNAPPSELDKFVSTKEGEDLAQKIGAKYFSECSALTRMNVKETFKEIANYIVKHKEETMSGKRLKFFYCC